MTRWCAQLLLFLVVVFSGHAAAQFRLPEGPLVNCDFTLQFNAAGTFDLGGAGWPSMTGTYVAGGRGWKDLFVE